MTGAPKLRSMELLDELEPTARRIYSGRHRILGIQRYCESKHRDPDCCFSKGDTPVSELAEPSWRSPTRKASGTKCS